MEKEEHIRFLVDVVRSFCNISGLKINWEKSALLGISCEEDEVKELAQQIGCGMENWQLSIWVYL